MGGEDGPTYTVSGNLIVEFRTREKGHPIPHAHAYYKGDKQHGISISYDGKIIAGNHLRSSRDEALAIQFVKKHAAEHEYRWR